MSITPTDADIHANMAFPAVARAARVHGLAFWGVLPFFVIAAASWALHHRTWVAVVALLISMTSVAGQIYGFRLARTPLRDLSDDEQIRQRAWKLATTAAKPRLIRWVPGL